LGIVEWVDIAGTAGWRTAGGVIEAETTKGRQWLPPLWIKVKLMLVV
jgi:hypothetical protein